MHTSPRFIDEDVSAAGLELFATIRVRIINYDGYNAGKARRVADKTKLDGFLAELTTEIAATWHCECISTVCSERPLTFVDATVPVSFGIGSPRSETEGINKESAAEMQFKNSEGACVSEENNMELWIKRRQLELTRGSPIEWFQNFSNRKSLQYYRPIPT